jgi:superfamily I DNA/RNA helicase/DNA polymerase III epsilon subunit-like protein
MSDGFDPTPGQRKAVEAPLGPVLVLAGPGAGKTYCLVARIHHLIARHGVAPARICAVTFTNKAAEEIRTRLHRALGAAGEEVVGGTLHSLSLGILRAHPEAAGLRRGFGVADEDYQRTVLRRLRVREERRGSLLTLFSRARLEQYPLTPGDQELFQAYRDTLRARNLVDFDELIALTERLLREDAAVAASERSRFDYLLVDEFQDLNLAQYGIVKHLVAGHGNLFAVGDDEQSIFSWTGADRQIFERFQTEFPQAPRIVLDQNRRCSVQIFEAARRLVERNPPLFEKDIAALRDSPYDVAAYVFEDEAAEAEWLVADLLEDRRHTDTPWGDYAVLYRYHSVGRALEARLLDAGIACRLARGQALLDDAVIAHVVACLRVVRAPDDPVAIEALARRALSGPFLERLALAAPGPDLLASLRAFARERPRGDAERDAAWRFVYMVENLRAMRRSHVSLEAVVDELLARRVGPFRNPLEERHHELSDPAEYPGAEALALRLADAVDAGAAIRLAPRGGTEIPLLGMLRKAGVPNVGRRLPGEVPAPEDLVLGSGEPPGGRWPLLLFKALQLLHARAVRSELTDFVAFDLETTDLDVAACEIVEIAAVRVRDGEVVGRFREMVAGGRPVSAGARRIHGYVDSDRRHASPFADVWNRFRAFVGTDLLVAHNGQRFDVPVLRRLAVPHGGADDLGFFDTYPLARALLDQGARLEDLAHHFGVPLARAHHALDDAEALAHVLGRLEALKAARGRKAALVQTLGHLGVALALDQAPSATAEERLLRDLAVPFALGRYSDCLEFYAAELEAGAPGAAPVADVIERLGGARVMERVRRERTPAERYPEAVARLEALMAGSRGAPMDEAIDWLLERVALSSSEGFEADPARVSLLTLHSTKGLEFSRVYVVGVEDNQLPGRRELQEQHDGDIQEARRLLYVGMTRAKDRLVLTRAERRDGRPTGGDLFLGEAGLAGIAARVAR